MIARQWAAVLAAALSVAQVHAQEVAITGFFSQGVDVSDDPESNFRSTSDLGATFRGDTGRTTWSISPGLRLLARDREMPDVPLTPRLDAALTTRTSDVTVSASLGFVSQFVEDAQFDDNARLVESSVLQFTARGQLGLNYALDARDNLSAGFSARATQFSEETEDLQAAQTFGVNGGFQRRLTPSTSINFGPSASLFFGGEDDGAGGSSFALRTGFNHQRTSRLSLSGSLGPSFTLPEGEDAQVGVVGGLGLSYRGRQATASLNLSQDVIQDDSGEIENRTSIGFGLGAPINSVSSVNIGGGVGLSTPLLDSGEDGRTSFSIAPRYSLRLSEDWSLNLSLRYRLVDDEDGLEDSSALLIGLSRGLSILP